MNLNPINFNYIDGKNTYPIQDYVDEQLNNLVTNQIYTSNVILNDNKKLNNVLYYIGGCNLNNPTNHLILSNNYNFGEIQFNTFFKYPENSNYIGTIIDYTGKLKVYHNYNILQPTFPAGYYEVETEILQLKADGINTDLQLTGIEASIVTINGDLIAINGELISINNVLNLLNGNIVFLQEEIDYIAGELTERAIVLQSSESASEIISDLTSYLNRDRNVIGNTVNKFGQYGIVAAGIGVVGAIFGFLYNDRMSNMAYKIESSNFQITAGDRSNLIYKADSQNVLYANQYISNTYNLNVNQGFINSNILTTQRIPIISTLGITVNNTGSATYSLINFSNATNNSAGYIGLGGIVSGYHNNNIIYNTPSAHIFNVPGQNSLSIPAFSINASACVGIGINPSAYPLYRLSVDGDIYIHSGKALRANSIIYNSQELSTTLNNYVLKSGSTMTGALTTNSIIYNAQELSTTLNNYLLKSGGVLSGQLYFNTQLYGNPGPYPQGFNGDRILLQTGIGTGYPYSIGIGTGNLTNNTFWFCSPSNASYKWYSGPTNTATLDNTGLLTLPSITTTANLAVNGKTQLLNYTVIGYSNINFDGYSQTSIFANQTTPVNLILSSLSSNYGATLLLRNNVDTTSFITVGGSNTTPTLFRNNLVIASTNSIILNGGNRATETPDFFINSTNGNIGIGTNNPLTNKLYVNGTTRFDDAITYRMDRWNISTEGVNRNYYSSNGTSFYSCGNAMNAHYFMKDSSRGYNPIMILANDGNVDIYDNLNLSTGVLKFGSRTQDFLLYLFSTDYGFGVNSYTLRYNCPSAASHKFYNGTTNTATIDGSGNLTTSGYVFAGGTTSGLRINGNDYGNTIYQNAVTIGGQPANIAFTLRDNNTFNFWSLSSTGGGYTNIANMNTTAINFNKNVTVNADLLLKNDVWHKSIDNVYRNYYANNSTSYYSCGNNANAHYFMKDSSRGYNPIVIMKNDGIIENYGLTRSINYFNFGTTLNYQASYNGYNAGGWYFPLNQFWEGYSTVSYIHIAITCLGINAVYCARALVGQSGGLYFLNMEFRNPTGTNQIDVYDIWGGSQNALRITINNGTYGGQFNIKISG